MPNSGRKSTKRKEGIVIRNLKVLGPALALGLAIGAMTAPTATATDLFTASKEKAWVTGIASNVVIEFTTSMQLECTTSVLTGTLVNGSSEITARTSLGGKPNATPHGEDCTESFGGGQFGEAKFDMNDCHFKLTGSTTGSDGGADATVWIECPAGTSIQITDTRGCTISIPSQTPTSGGVTYANLPNHVGGSAIKIITTLTGITYSTNFTCQFIYGMPVESNNVDFIATTILTGYEDLGGTMTAPTEGAQIPIQWS
jgi:hypothetical protein